MAESIVQSHGGRIVLLPAFPPGWATGAMPGLVVRQGARIDLAWADGRPTHGSFTAPLTWEVEIELVGRARALALVPGGSLALTPECWNRSKELE